MNKNNDIVEIYDFNGDIIETLSLDIFLDVRALVKLISNISTIFIILEILFLFIVLSGLLFGSSEYRFIIMPFSINGIFLFALIRCLIEYRNNNLSFDQDNSFFLKKERILSTCKIIAVVIILSMITLVWNIFWDKIDFKNFKSQTIISEQSSEDILLDDVAIKKIVGEDAPRYEYNICSDSHCGTYISEKNIIADKYSVRKITTTLDYPKISSEDIVSYQLFFLDERPILDTFKTEGKVFKQAYQTYQVYHVFASIFLGIIIVLGCCLLHSLFPYRKEHTRITAD